MADSYMGEIRCFSFGFPPVGWLSCNGQQLLIRQYPALYSLIGTMYGGDGQNTFNVPNMQSRATMGVNPSGSHPGTYDGDESITLQDNEIPYHQHTVQAFSHNNSQLDNLTNQPGPTTFLTNAGWTVGQPPSIATSIACYSNLGKVNTTLNIASISIIGAYTSHENRMPFLAMNFCISTEGEYPIFN